MVFLIKPPCRVCEVKAVFQVTIIGLYKDTVMEETRGTTVLSRDYIGCSYGSKSTWRLLGLGNY